MAGAIVAIVLVVFLVVMFARTVRIVPAGAGRDRRALRALSPHAEPGPDRA